MCHLLLFIHCPSIFLVYMYHDNKLFFIILSFYLIVLYCPPLLSYHSPHHCHSPLTFPFVFLLFGHPSLLSFIVSLEPYHQPVVHCYFLLFPIVDPLFIVLVLSSSNQTKMSLNNLGPINAYFLFKMLRLERSWQTMVWTHVSLLISTFFIQVHKWLV
jgi:hypothetical protein